MNWLEIGLAVAAANAVVDYYAWVNADCSFDAGEFSAEFHAEPPAWVTAATQYIEDVGLDLEELAVLQRTVLEDA